MNKDELETIYLQINCRVLAGLNHQLGNFEQSCILARCLDATLVPSETVLNSRLPYSASYSTTLTEFVDFSKVMSYGQPMSIAEEVPENIPRHEMVVSPETKFEEVQSIITGMREQGAGYLIVDIQGHNLLRYIGVFGTAVKQMDERYKNMPQAKSFYFPMGAEAQRIATLVTGRIGKPYTCIHVRRGDHHDSDSYRLHSSLNSIAKWLAACGLPNVYVMSDERPEYFHPLREQGFDLFCYTDFPELVALTDKKSFGGHMLYPVERILLSMAARRVLTRPQGFQVLSYADALSPHPTYDYTLVPPHGPHRTAALPPEE